MFSRKSSDNNDVPQEHLDETVEELEANTQGQNRIERQDRAPIRAPLKPSIIGEGFEFIGTIKSEGVLNVVGVVSGKVTAKSVTVDVGGKVEGELITEQLLVKGTVLGEVTCQELNVGPRALIDGTISYETINIQRGGRVAGKFLKK